MAARQKFQIALAVLRVMSIMADLMCSLRSWESRTGGNS